MSTGDVVTLVVGIGAALISMGSAVIAIRANAIARAANAEAEEANRIAAEALDVQRSALPSAWSGAVKSERTRVAFQNQSGRNIVVTEVEAVPLEADGFVRYSTDPPTRVEYGDAYEIHVLRTVGESAQALRLVWHFEDETEDQVTERRL